MRSPHELVGSAAYLRELDETIRSQGFPDPDPGLAEALTEARHVAAEAEAAGEDAFAEEVRNIRESPFQALRRFGYVMQGNATEGEHPQRDEALEELTPRERTFLDFPGPPPQYVNAAEDRGRADFEAELPEFDVDSDEGRDAACARERRTVSAVVAGAAALAEEFYEERGEQEESPSGVEYRSAEEYGDVMAFNAGLVADGMLESGRGPIGEGSGQGVGPGGPPGGAPGGGPMGPGGGPGGPTGDPPGR